MDAYKAVSQATSVTSAVAKTVLQLAAPSGRRVRFVNVAVSFNGASASVAKVDLVRQDGTGTTTTSVTPAPLDVDAPASTVTASTGWTVEPATTATLESWYVTQNGSVFIVPFNAGEEPVVDVSSRIGVVVTAGGTSNCIVSATYLE